MGDSTIQDLKNKIESTSEQFLHLLPEEFDAEACTDLFVKMLQDFVKDHSGDLPTARRNSGPKRDTPGAETFFWSVWETCFKLIGQWEGNQETSPRVIKTIALFKVFRAQPEGKYVWTIWGEDIDIASLPLLGASIRECNNGPFYYTGPDDSAMSRPEVQNTLAGAGTGDSTEACALALKRRREWLALQALIARLASDLGLESYLLHGVWAIRDGLEDWPLEPPSIITMAATNEPPNGEDTAAYRALLAEGAALWLYLAAPQLYACTEIWGPNGNPDWKANQGVPGRGGERWKGVDGMDRDKKRWGLWKEVLEDVIGWYDREAGEGRGSGWRVKEMAVKALEAMNAAEQQ